MHVSEKGGGFLRNALKKISSKSDEQYTLHLKKNRHPFLHLGVSCLEMGMAKVPK
jgi:hypothetical protein